MRLILICKSERIMKHFKIIQINHLLWCHEMILQRHILYCGLFYFKQNENRLQSSQKSRPERRVGRVGGVIKCDWVATRMCDVCGYAEILQIDQIFSSLTMRQLTSVMYQQRRNTIQPVRRKNVIHCNKHHQHNHQQ